jgi:hypothetical protein
MCYLTSYIYKDRINSGVYFEGIVMYIIIKHTRIGIPLLNTVAGVDIQETILGKQTQSFDVGTKY